MSGHEERTLSIDPNMAPRNTSGRDQTDFPGFFQNLRGTPTYTRSQSILIGTVTYMGQAALQQDIANLKATQGKDLRARC